MLSLVALFTQCSEVVIVKREFDALYTFSRHKRHHMVDIHGLASDTMGEALLTQRVVGEVRYSKALPPNILVDFLPLFSLDVDNMRLFSFFNFINSWHIVIYDKFLVYLYNKKLNVMAELNRKRAKDPISFRLSISDEMELKKLAAKLGTSPNNVARALTSKGIQSLIYGER